MSERVDVAIIGGGPAGLSAAAALARSGAGRVIVVERELAAGGIPRHADHPGFGIRDLRRFLSGPNYAQRLVARAADAGVELRTGTQVTGWSDDGALQLTGPAGRASLSAGAFVLAAGCRERPRSARLIPGARPLGAVMNTAQLQQLVHLGHTRLDGRRALVVGAEHVSYSALQTLHQAGARTVAIVTEQPRHQSFAAFAAGARIRFSVPLRTRVRVTDIAGLNQVEEVTLTDLESGREERLACDLVILTADWIPDHELAVLAGARLDRGTKGPAVDAAGRTTRPGLFAAGNVLHGAETADVAALAGTAVAAAVIAHAAGASWPAPLPEIICEPPLHWLVPGAGRCRVRSLDHLLDVRVEISQDGRVLARHRLARVMPGRSATLPATWLGTVDHDAGPVRVRLVSGRYRTPASRKRQDLEIPAGGSVARRHPTVCPRADQPEPRSMQSPAKGS